MKPIIRRRLCLLLLFALLGGLAVPASASAADVGALVLAQSPAPAIGSIGGEWAVLGLARSGADVPADYALSYYLRAAQTVCDADGVLSTRKYSDYARVVLALTAIGRDATDVAGYDLLAPLGDFDAVVRQGVNGVIWALLALSASDAAAYQTAAMQAVRQQYLNELLSRQLPDGGWALSGDTAGADLTAMALTALAPYRAQAADAINRALACLSDLQLPDGGFSSYGVETAESAAQVIIALATLGISFDDARFVKGATVPENLHSFLLDGGYCHVAGGAVNQMATEQALLALCAAERAAAGQNALFDLRDAPVPGDGLSGCDSAVCAPAKSASDAAFSDIDGHADQLAIEALAARGVIHGRSASVFDPDALLTRAEFAALISRALSLAETAELPFSDVSSSSRLASAIGAAYRAGIVHGLTETIFLPSRTLTRQEAAAMIARAAALCGLDTAVPDAAAVLAPYTDGAQCATYACEPLAFCLRFGILTAEGAQLAPRQAITRGEMAQLLYRLLLQANLI